MVFSSWFASRRTTFINRCRPALEILEDRTVLALTLGTALSVGHELGSSSAFDVATDAAGNSFVTGAFSGTTDFDPGHTYPGDLDILTARGSDDIYVAKYAPDSSLVWVVRMGGDSPRISGAINDVGRSITTDGSGNIYVAGQFTSSADFGSVTLSSTGDSDKDGFVTKLNSSGNVLWANRWGTTFANGGDDVGVDAIGNVYACGSTQPGSATLNGLNVLKYSSTGTMLWNIWINTRMALSSAMAVSPTGNVYIGGHFLGTVDFDPGNGSKYVTSSPLNYQSGFVLKLTTSGNFGWVSPFVGLTSGSNGSSDASSIALDGTGNIIVAGFYRGPVDFNPGSGTTTLPIGGGGFMTKLNSSGGLVWAKAQESPNMVGVNGLAVDAANNIYATGWFNGTVDFDPGVGTTSRTTAGASDVFVMKLTSSGNFGWAETFGDTGNDTGYGIAVDPSGTIHLAGSYRGTVDFDPTDIYFLSNSGPYTNMFLVRLHQS